MPSLSEVEQKIVELCAETEPSGYIVQYYPGWPFSEQLEIDLKNNKFHVNVFPYSAEKRVTWPVNTDPFVISETIGQAVIGREVSRQLKQFQINVWANSPDTREVIGEAVKQNLDFVDIISFSDTTKGPIKYVSQTEDDSGQKANVYRRIYFYEVEYSTVKQETVYRACQPQIINEDGDVVAPGSGTTVLVNDLD